MLFESEFEEFQDLAEFQPGVSGEHFVFGAEAHFGAFFLVEDVEVKFLGESHSHNDLYHVCSADRIVVAVLHGHKLDFVKFGQDNVWLNFGAKLADVHDELLLLLLVEAKADDCPDPVGFFLDADIDDAALVVEEPADGLANCVLLGLRKGVAVAFVLASLRFGFLDDFVDVETGAAAERS
jgi:hypothetical protein